ncbi:MAG: cytochrome c [Alphaproteobacteria bacterium]|nr:cytochrome c [Alphaproteobacteria bacterium]
MSPGLRIAAFVIFALLALTAVLTWRFGPPSTDALSPQAPTLAVGERIYADHCASCHGTKLEGQPDWQRRLPDGTLPAPPHDATGHTWHHSDRELWAVVRNGGGAEGQTRARTSMPAFAGTLSDQDIRAVVAYIKSRWPQEIRERQARINAGQRG